MGIISPVRLRAATAANVRVSTQRATSARAESTCCGPHNGTAPIR